MKAFVSEQFGLRKISNNLVSLLFVACALLLPQFIHDSFILRLMAQVWIYSLLTLGQNIITGWTGMLSMGQSAFYGLGAYTAALLALKLNMPWFYTFLLSGLVAGLFGAVLGFPCVRLGSDYLTLMTVGFNNIALLVFLNWIKVTRGPLGLGGIKPPSIGDFVMRTPVQYYYLFLLIMVLCYLAVRGMINSKIGRALIAIRDDEEAAKSMGVNLAYYKVLAFGVGSLLAGIAGNMLAHFILFVGPTSFSIEESLLHMQMAILGGLGSLPGSILGAAILTIVPQFLQMIYEYRMLFNGVLMVVLMVWRPQGLLGSTAAGVSVRTQFQQLLSRVTGGKAGERDVASNTP